MKDNKDYCSHCGERKDKEYYLLLQERIRTLDLRLEKIERSYSNHRKNLYAHKI